MNKYFEIPVIAPAKYRCFLPRIGVGSFSEVFRGCVIGAEREQVAVKRVNRRKNSSKEVSILQSLDHPNIVKLIDVIEDQDNDYLYLILEYCDGGDLFSFVTQQKTPICEEQVIYFSKQIVSALRYIHQKRIVHRDLKPHNILISGGTTLKLTDFGLSKESTDEDDQQITQTHCGSPLYMSPEALRGGDYNSKTDLWSLGVILYEMAYGKPPVPARSVFELNSYYLKRAPIFFQPPLTSKPLQKLIERLLKYDPNERLDWTDLFMNPLFTDSMTHSMPIVIATTKKVIEDHAHSVPEEIVAPHPQTTSSMQHPKTKLRLIRNDFVGRKKSSDAMTATTTTSSMFNKTLSFIREYADATVEMAKDSVAK